jgi:leucyl/phenylalanyl-tRNA--protein transferase
MRGFGVEELLACYARGVFPMAESRSDTRVYLLEPDERGVIPLDRFHIPKSLKKTVRRDDFTFTVNRCFETVVRSCAASAPGREDSWINDQILMLYLDMHAEGHAHSIEAWKDGKLAGGLYGVSLGAAFFGESMFSRQTDASKASLVALIARLKVGGYRLLDTQFNTDHLKRFGAETISQATYRDLLDAAIDKPSDFFALPEGVSGDQLLQSITQTS